jgi:hypothetical protein
MAGSLLRTNLKAEHSKPGPAQYVGRAREKLVVTTLCPQNPKGGL